MIIKKKLIENEAMCYLVSNTGVLGKKKFEFSPIGIEPMTFQLAI